MQSTTPAHELGLLAASLKDYYSTICHLLTGGVLVNGPGGGGTGVSLSNSSGGLNNSGGAAGGGGGGLGGEEGEALMDAFSSALALLEPDVRATFSMAGLENGT
jgi:hypothetical protein